MRVVATTDFYGSFWPTRTSWGYLPGAKGLLDAVARQREADPDTAWIDTGDFAQGGPLAPATSGKGGFETVARFGRRCRDRQPRTRLGLPEAQP